MTVICGGGTSGPKIGTALVAEYSAARAVQLLIAAGVSEFNPLLPLAALVPIVASTFCGTDPPALPTFTSAEATAIVALDITNPAFLTGFSKFGDLLKNLFWYDLCQCTSGSLTPLVVPPRPSTTPITSPPLPAAVGSCQDTDTIIVNINSCAFPCVDLISIPAGATTVRLTWHSIDNTGPPHSAWVGGGLMTDNHGATTATLPNVNVPALGSWQQDFSIPVGSVTLRATIVSATDPTSHDIAMAHAVFYCNGALPGASLSPCCQPDPATQAQLDAIYKMVVLLQRQLVPFAYIRGAPIATNITGAGVLAIQGLLGVLVDVTAFGPTTKQIGVSPVFYDNVGFLTFGTPDGYPSPWEITRQHQVMMPQRCSAFTQLFYDLFPGTSITITPLLREPE